MSDVYNDQAGTISELLPSVAVATASMGESAEMLDADARSKDFDQLWQGLHSHLDAVPAAPPLAAVALPTQLGPFTWNPIVFGNGVPVGGWAQLTLFSNGAVNFTGHFHDSGAPSYNVACTFAVRAAGDGTVYTFTKSGRMHGTFESGSRNFDWGDNPTQTAVAAGWRNFGAGWSWQARAAVNADIGALVDSAVKAVGQAASVIAIIA